MRMIASLFGSGSDAHRGSAVLAVNGGSDADNSLVDSSLNAIVLLDVKFGELVVFVCG
jgi:hypothetical protein